MISTIDVSSMLHQKLHHIQIVIDAGLYQENNPQSQTTGVKGLLTGPKQN
jgi:hypothetical protein